VELKVKNNSGILTVKNFNNFSVNLKYDSIGSTFSFNILFDETNKTQAEFLSACQFNECTVEHNGQLLITGTLLAHSFRRASVKELVQIAGYSKPGVFEDCEIPTSLYPLQTDGLSLKQITERLIKPFGIKLIIDEVAQKDSLKGTVKQKSDQSISKSTASESQNIKSYLTELTKQRHIILTHNNKGNLVFTEAKTDLQPLFHVEDGILATEINVSISGQSLHSHITVIKQADSDGGNSAEFTITNPYCTSVYRPKVIKMDSGDDITIEQAAINALAAELKEAIRLVITTDRWQIDNTAIVPNNIITVLSPENWIYEITKFFIEEVNLTGDEKKTTAVITCVLPEVYNGKKPIKNIFINPTIKFPIK
jgi:prophage tail gpP-like protein